MYEYKHMYVHMYEYKHVCTHKYKWNHYQRVPMKACTFMIPVIKLKHWLEPKIKSLSVSFVP